MEIWRRLLMLVVAAICGLFGPSWAYISPHDTPPVIAQVDAQHLTQGVYVRAEWAVGAGGGPVVQVTLQNSGAAPWSSCVEIVALVRQPGIFNPAEYMWDQLAEPTKAAVGYSLVELAPGTTQSFDITPVSRQDRQEIAVVRLDRGSGQPARVVTLLEVSGDPSPGPN